MLKYNVTFYLFQILCEKNNRIFLPPKIYCPEKFGVWDNGSKFKIKGFDEKGKLIFETIKDEGFLYGRHSNYFSYPEEARAAVELVLSAPERVRDINGNASVVGVDEATGKIYRIEIQKEAKANANHTRSVFEITPAQYQKIKLEAPPVLQPSSTDSSSTTGYRKTRTLSNFLRYNTTDSEKINTQNQENDEKNCQR